MYQKVILINYLHNSYICLFYKRLFQTTTGVSTGLVWIALIRSTCAEEEDDDDDEDDEEDDEDDDDDEL